MSADYGFPRMAEIVPPSHLGEAVISHFTIDEAAAGFSRMRAAISSDRHAGVSPGTYAKLTVGGKLVMSDTDMERQTNCEFRQRANGSVLIGGLGLGMVIHPILAKRDVTKVTVIEKSADVIALVSPTLPEDLRLRVICADIFEWMPAKGVKFDVAYFDIWPDRSDDNIDEAATLHRRFARRLNRNNPHCWMGSWMVDELRYERRRDRNRFGGYW